MTKAVILNSFKAGTFYHFIFLDHWILKGPHRSFNSKAATQKELFPYHSEQMIMGSLKTVINFFDQPIPF